MPTVTHPLTEHQKKVLSYVRDFQQKHGYSPSLSDLASAFGVKSKNAIAKVINALFKSGCVQKDPKGRIKIVDRIGDVIAESLALPLFGPIAAGFAAPVEEQAEETITLDNYFIRDRSSTFLLRVKGDSMVEAGIHEGDLVIVERGREPRLGDVVVGVLDGEFTLKRLIRQNGRYALKAENVRYPTLYAMEELTVAGVVRGVMRKY
jgi:repressor LexA